MNYTKIFRPNLVLDNDIGTRQQTEQFYPLTQGDWDRINRDNVGFNVGQFHPELNPRNVIPKVTFGGGGLRTCPATRSTTVWSIKARRG